MTRHVAERCLTMASRLGVPAEVCVGVNGSKDERFATCAVIGYGVFDDAMLAEAVILHAYLTAHNPLKGTGNAVDFLLNSVRRWNLDLHDGEIATAMRKRVGMPAYDVGEKVGVSKATISRFERTGQAPEEFHRWRYKYSEVLGVMNMFWCITPEAPARGDDREEDAEGEVTGGTPTEGAR